MVTLNGCNLSFFQSTKVYFRIYTWINLIENPIKIIASLWSGPSDLHPRLEWTGLCHHNMAAETKWPPLRRRHIQMHLLE